ncbi:MAG: ankyrin repeat domain-containing protein [Planctomycetaceae bacterium]|nr:ankyrin repeat domain-containing protein [Planctomycetaceae bacterium]
MKKNFSKNFRLMFIVLIFTNLSTVHAETLSSAEPLSLNAGPSIFWIIILFLLYRFFTSKSEYEDTHQNRQDDFFSDEKKRETIIKNIKPTHRKVKYDSRPQSSSSQDHYESKFSGTETVSLNLPSTHFPSNPDTARKNAQETLFFQKTNPPHTCHPEKSSSENILAPIYELAGHGKLELLRKKLAKGANINEQDPFFYETGLHRAAKRGDAAAVQLLLESGADVRFVTIPYGETPLHFAVSGRNPQVIRLLLQYGANPNAKDCFGRTPAQCSRFYGELSEIFEKAGVKI